MKKSKVTRSVFEVERAKERAFERGGERGRWRYVPKEANEDWKCERRLEYGAAKDQLPDELKDPRYMFEDDPPNTRRGGGACSRTLRCEALPRGARRQEEDPLHAPDVARRVRARAEEHYLQRWKDEVKRAPRARVACTLRRQG